MDTAELIDTLRATRPDLLVATDFDGVLAPLVADPETSRPVDGAVEALAALASAGVQVAVVTGRDAGTVLRLGGLDRVPGLVIAGLYGIETWHDGALDSPGTPAPMAELAHRLPGVLVGADPDVWIEDKRLSLVVHGRRAADPAAALAPLREPVQRLADELALELHPGRDVLELRLPGYDKAGALHRLAAGHAGVLYLGDDLGDLPAFGEIARLRAAGRVAYGVGVTSSGVPEVAEVADVLLASPAEVVDLFARLHG